MAITRANATKQAATNAITALVNAGAAAGKFRLYAGGLAGTLICTCTCADPAFAAAATDGDAQLASAASGTAVAAGDMNAFELCDSNNVRVESGSVGTSGADLNFASGVHREIGETVQITSYQLNACVAVT